MKEYRKYKPHSNILALQAKYVISKTKWQDLLKCTWVLRGAAAEKQLCVATPSGEGRIGDGRWEQPGKEWLRVDANMRVSLL